MSLSGPGDHQSVRIPPILHKLQVYRLLTQSGFEERRQ
jgi:hypothetical protein